MDNDCITFSSEAHRLCILNKAQNVVQTEDILIQNFTELYPIGKKYISIYMYYQLSVNLWCCLLFLVHQILRRTLA